MYNKNQNDLEIEQKEFDDFENHDIDFEKAGL